MGSAGGRLAVLLASTLFALTVAELAARLFEPNWQPRRAERATFWRYDAELGWSHVPGQTGRFVGPGWDVTVQINDRGLRDVPHTYQRSSPRPPRLLLLADSFGWGFGVEQDQSLASRLRAACPDLEVVNASASGYSTDQEVLWYRREGVRYRPDLVLLLIHSNDMEGNSYPRFYGYPKPFFELTETGLRLENVPVPKRALESRVYGWLTAHTYLTNGLRQAWPGLAVRFEGPPFVGPDGPPIRPEVTRRLLLRFAAELRKTQVEMRWALISMDPRLSAWFRNLGSQAGVPVLDLGPAFDAAESRGRVLWLEGDPHWNADGHRLAADEIRKTFFSDCQVLPASAAREANGG